MYRILPRILQLGFPATLSATGSGDLQPWLETGGCFQPPRSGGVAGADDPDSAIIGPVVQQQHGGQVHPGRVRGRSPVVGPGGWNEGFVGRPAVSVPVVLAFQRPDFHQFEEPGRRPGQKGHHLPEAGPLDLAGLAGAALGVGRPLEAGQGLEVSLVLAGGIALSVARRARGSRRGGVLWRSCDLLKLLLQHARRLSWYAR